MRAEDQGALEEISVVTGDKAPGSALHLKLQKDLLMETPGSPVVVVKGLCQGLVLSDYVSLVVDGVYLNRFSSTSGAPWFVFVVHSNWFPVMAVT